MALDSYNGNMTLECLHQIITSLGNNFVRNGDMFSCFNIIVRKYLKDFGTDLRRFTVDVLVQNLHPDAVSTFKDVVEWLTSMLQNQMVNQREARKAVEYVENRALLQLALLATFDLEGSCSVEGEILRVLEGLAVPEDAPFAFALQVEESIRLFISVSIGSLCFPQLHFLLSKVFCLLVDSGYLEWITRNIDSLEIGLKTPFLCEGSFTLIRDMLFNCSCGNVKAIIDHVFETLFQQAKSHVLAAELVHEIFANNLASVENRLNRLSWMNDLAEWIPETMQPKLKEEMQFILKELLIVEVEDCRHDPFFVVKMHRLLSE